jgi:predicted Zn-ribbon and HTH transcriptional regulator
MSQTIRQIIASMLEREELSALDLAGDLLLTADEVEDHLRHLKSSHKGRLRVRPAGCRRCGFVFRDRQRLDAPGRCPRCREEQVEGPWFSLGA